MRELIDFSDAEASGLTSNVSGSRGDLMAKPPRSCASEDDFSRLGLVDRDAAIDNYALPIYERPCLRNQQYCRTRDLIRLADPTHTRTRFGISERFWIVP